jgi:hypothetical protein
MTMSYNMMIGYDMIFTIVLQWSIFDQFFFARDSTVAIN